MVLYPGDRYPKVELLAAKFWVYWEPFVLLFFVLRLDQTTFPPAVDKSSFFTTSPPKDCSRYFWYMPFSLVLRWCLIVVLVCISLIASGDNQFFMCCWPSKSLHQRSVFHFLSPFLDFGEGCSWQVFYIFWISTLYLMYWVQTIFPHSVVF